MKNIGDLLMYKKDVCKVVDIIKNPFNDKMCYVLNPVCDEKLKLTVPIDTKSIRNLMTKEEVLELIKKIPEVEEFQSNSVNIEKIYKDILHDASPIDLVKVIKTSYLRNQRRINNKKKISDRDDRYFKESEKILYNEIAYSLGITYDEAKEFIKTKVEEYSND